MSAATHYLFVRNAMSPKPTLLSVDALDFGYPQCNVFQGFSLRCNAGLILLCGDESTGKTTLLRLLAGELAAQKGRVAVGGVDAVQEPERYSAQVLDRPRSDALNTTTAQAWLDAPPPSIRAGMRTLWRCTLQALRWQSIWPNLFMRCPPALGAKVCMAAALASGAPLTLIDDPIAGLDKPSVTYLTQALNSCADEPERVVVVAHHAPLPGVRWAHRVDLAGLGR